MSLLGVRGLGVLSLALGGGALIGFAGGCFITNKAHCGYHENGADNPCPSGYVCNVCEAENNGCVPEAQRDAIPDHCVDSGGTTTVSTQTGTQTDPTSTATTIPTGTSTDTTTTSTTTSTTEPPITTTETSTTEVPVTTAMIECDPNNLEDPACDEQYCVGPDQCGWCVSIPAPKTCADVSPLTPACDAGSGKCVECTAEESALCTGNTPVCVDNECAPCTEHSQCPDTACDIETGACFPNEPESIVYVQGTNLCVNPQGTKANPFCTFGQVQLEEGKPLTIKVLPGVKAMAPLSVPTGDFIVAVRPDTGTPEFDGTANQTPTVQVSSGNRVYLWKLTFTKSGASAILQCTQTPPAPQGILYVDDTKIQSNGTESTTRALAATGCKVRMRRTRVLQCGAGVQVTGGSLRVDSCAFTDNGVAATSVFGAFNFVSPADVTISYSTFADHPATKSSSTFNCAGVKPPDGIVVRNSVILNLDPLEHPNCADWIEMTNTMVHSGATLNDLVDTKGQWVTGPTEGVYSAKKDGGLKDQAMWGEGDPLLDVNLTPISQDAPSYAGCDQPPL